MDGISPPRKGTQFLGVFLRGGDGREPRAPKKREKEEGAKTARRSGKGVACRSAEGTPKGFRR